MTNAIKPVDWQALIFDPSENWISRLEHVASRRFFDDNLSDEAFNFAFERIQKDDWSKLNKFEHKSSPGTFLITVFRNLVEDFAISKFGKCRPPVWVQKLGEIWKTCHKRLCCEKKDNKSVCYALTCDEFSYDDIEAIVVTIKGKIPNCGMQVLQKENSEDFAVELIEDSSVVSAEQSSSQYLFSNIISSLSQVLTLSSENSAVSDLSTKISNKKESLISKLSLCDQQILILKLIYQENMKVSEVARMLSLPDHQVRKQSKLALEHLKSVLLQQGINTDVLFN